VNLSITSPQSLRASVKPGLEVLTAAENWATEGPKEGLDMITLADAPLWTLKLVNRRCVEISGSNEHKMALFYSMFLVLVVTPELLVSAQRSPSSLPAIDVNYEFPALQYAGVTDVLQTVRDRVRSMSQDMNNTLESVQQFVNAADAIVTHRSSTHQLKATQILASPVRRALQNWNRQCCLSMGTSLEMAYF